MEKNLSVGYIGIVRRAGLEPANPSQDGGFKDRCGYQFRHLRIKARLCGWWSPNSQLPHMDSIFGPTLSGGLLERFSDYILISSAISHRCLPPVIYIARIASDFFRVLM